VANQFEVLLRLPQEGEVAVVITDHKSGLVAIVIFMARGELAQVAVGHKVHSAGDAFVVSVSPEH
jgi:hypothetical protein